MRKSAHEGDGRGWDSAQKERNPKEIVSNAKSVYHECCSIHSQMPAMGNISPSIELSWSQTLKKLTLAKVVL